MSIQAEIDKKVRLIEKDWAEIGMCQTCGWHGAFHESEQDIREQLEAETDGTISIATPCVSDNEDTSDHKGVRFDINDLLRLGLEKL